MEHTAPSLLAVADTLFNPYRGQVSISPVYPSGIYIVSSHTGAAKEAAFPHMPPPRAFQRPRFWTDSIEINYNSNNNTCTTNCLVNRF